MQLNIILVTGWRGGNKFLYQRLSLGLVWFGLIFNRIQYVVHICISMHAWPFIECLCFIANKHLFILDNTQIVKEFGSFSSYVWAYVDFKPVINRYRYPRNVPLRTPKAEALSRDLLKRGFRFVGPVIVYSFMQAAGMSIDHLVDCFRFGECVSIAERPWRHV